MASGSLFRKHRSALTSEMVPRTKPTSRLTWRLAEAGYTATSRWTWHASRTDCSESRLWGWSSHMVSRTECKDSRSCSVCREEHCVRYLKRCHCWGQCCIDLQCGITEMDVLVTTRQMLAPSGELKDRHKIYHWGYRMQSNYLCSSCVKFAAF